PNCLDPGRRAERRGGGDTRRVGSADAALARDHAGGTTALDAVSGSSSPASKRNGGYSGVISAPYAVTRKTQRLSPRTKSKIERGYSPRNSSTSAATKTRSPVRPNQLTPPDQP